MKICPNPPFWTIFSLGAPEQLLWQIKSNFSLRVFFRGDIDHCCLAVALLILPLPFSICFSLDRKRRNHICEMRRKWKRFDSRVSDSFKLVAQIFLFSPARKFSQSPAKKNSNSDACRFVVTLRMVNKWQRSKSFENVAWSEPGKAKELFGIKLGEYGKRKTILRIR